MFNTDRIYSFQHIYSYIYRINSSDIILFPCETGYLPDQHLPETIFSTRHQTDSWVFHPFPKLSDMLALFHKCRISDTFKLNKDCIVYFFSALSSSNKPYKGMCFIGTISDCNTSRVYNDILNNLVIDKKSDIIAPIVNRILLQ